MTRRPVALLDVDGVLANMMGSLHDELALEGHECPEHDDVNQWDFLSLFKSNDARCAAVLMLRRRMFWQSLSAYHGAWEFVEKLREYGAEVLFVTADYHDCEEWLRARKVWLIANMGAESSDVIIASRKEYVAGDLFIDDKPDNVAAWQHRNRGGVGLLMTRPWNVGERGFARLGGFDDENTRMVLAILANTAQQ